jgi:2-polyprenyl-3-methyl-5-hydroxy-6-metoxy-1,4-benzoquinol methylase
MGFDYDTIPPGYYDLVFRRRRGMQSKWHHLKFARVAGEIAGRRRLLDIGCGPGTFIGCFDEPGRTSVGVDISSPQVAYARLEYGSDTREFREDFPADGGFDAATIVEVIEHLERQDVDRLLEAGIERLAPGGKLVVTTPNYGSAWPVVESLVNRLGDVSYSFQHINKFTRTDLAALLARHGLDDVRVETTMLVAPFAAPLGWELADRLVALEQLPGLRNAGLLLIGSGVKR